MAVGLSSLAMGDSSACEYAQCSHLGVLLQVRAPYPGELLVQSAPPPRSLLSVGLVIDDLVYLHRCLDHEQDVGRASVGAERLHAALDAYRAAPLAYSERKTFSHQLQASFWGVDVCGVSGLVRTAPARYWPLTLITLRVVQLGLASRGLLESLLGSWVAVFLLRRRLLSLVDLCFKAVMQGDPQTILRLSPELCAELVSFVTLGVYAVLDLRASVLPEIHATDASSTWQAGVFAKVPGGVAQEFMRHSLQKGTWTRLLNPSAAYLHERGLLDPDDEAPGETFATHPVAVLAATVPAYSCSWRKEYSSRVHINVGELEAYLREEGRVAGARRAKRVLFGLDSQVCLGALAKGRSSSQVLNQLLSASLGPMLSSRIFPFYLYFPSSHNPADDPTRATDIRAPSRPEPFRGGIPCAR